MQNPFVSGFIHHNARAGKAELRAKKSSFIVLAGDVKGIHPDESPDPAYKTPPQYLEDRSSNLAGLDAEAQHHVLDNAAADEAENSRKNP